MSVSRHAAFETSIRQMVAPNVRSSFTLSTGGAVLPPVGHHAPGYPTYSVALILSWANETFPDEDHEDGVCNI